MQQSLAVSAAKAVWQPSVKIHSDETLIALIAAHDRNAMRDLFVRHKTRVFRFLLRVAGDAAAAEDLLNEVFIEIWRHAGKFEARSKVSTWMLAMHTSRPPHGGGGVPAINSTTTRPPRSRTRATTRRSWCRSRGLAL